MTDSSPDNPQPRQTVSPEAFAQFLQLLSADNEEAGRLYARLHEKLIGFFVLKGISDPASAADETLDRAVIKINSGTPVSNVNHYCTGIARNIAKERLRSMQREASAFCRFLENLADGSDEEVERIYRILKPCFEQLTGADQELLQAYCRIMQGRTRAEHRRHLAEIKKTTVVALRMRVTRLRDTLSDCVRNSLEEN